MNQQNQGICRIENIGRQGLPSLVLSVAKKHRNSKKPRKGGLLSGVSIFTYTPEVRQSIFGDFFSQERVKEWDFVKNGNHIKARVSVHNFFVKEM